MAILVNALLALRTGVVREQPALILLAVALLLCASATFAYGLVRRRALLTADLPKAVAEGALGMVTIAASVACMAGLGSLSIFH